MSARSKPKSSWSSPAPTADPSGRSDSERTPAAKKFRIIADKRLEGANNLISGANRNDYHLMNIDLQRDCAIDGYYDLRTVQAGEASPDGHGPLRIVHGIELGHIFKLGTKYSDALNARFLDEHGKEQPIIMGSYGIGMERIVACHIEQNHDANGIIWDPALAPVPGSPDRRGDEEPAVVETAERLYTAMQEAGVEVLFDDRKDMSPGFKFKDADLLGMPYQVIVGEKNLAAGKIEIKERQDGERRCLVPREDLMEELQKLCRKDDHAVPVHPSISAANGATAVTSGRLRNPYDGSRGGRSMPGRAADIDGCHRGRIGSFHGDTKLPAYERAEILLMHIAAGFRNGRKNSPG